MSERDARTEEIGEFVIAVFRGALGRDPEPVALDHYTKALSNGVYSKAQLLDVFLRSYEFRLRFESKSSAAIGLSSLEVDEFIHYGKGGQKYRPFIASPAVFGKLGSRYMETANCVSQDFLSPRFADFCARIGRPVSLHRKLWEYGFVAHHLQENGVLRAGVKGVGFGVGAEPLPSFFASLGCQILATDTPPSVGSEGWSLRNLSGSYRGDLFNPTGVNGEVYDRNVYFRPVDARNIDDNICNFDFCWSVDCIGALGSIEDGLNFIESSVRSVVKVGGICIHTGELNISDNDDRTETDDTSLYRVRDVDRLISRLEERGHKCTRLPIEPGSSFSDYIVGVPPFGDVHLKWKTGEFVRTSFGIVVTRGK